MTPLRMTLVVAALGAASAVAVACLDLTPILYETSGGPDASIPPALDAGEDGEPVDGAEAGDEADAIDTRPPCVRCLNTPDDAAPAGCEDEINACLAESACAATYACALVNHCFEQPSFRDIVNCGLPCAEAAGIVTSTDPALTLIYDVAVCAQSRCNGPCQIGDAGLGLD
ncbi:MAG: hypothetical protein ACRELB_00850 [Polyangiaceae bacterium]